MTEPEPQDSRAALRASRLKLLLLFLIPLLAIGFASLVYYTGVGLPRATSNKGELLVPPRQIDELAVQAVDGVRWRHANGEGGWSLLSIARDACEQDCRERLHLSRQIRLALGKEAHRIHRLHLQLGDAAGTELRDFVASEHPDLQLLQADADAFARWLGPGTELLGEAHPMLLIDPQGFAMMVYLARNPGSDTISDLRFLLKYSREKVR